MKMKKYMRVYAIGMVLGGMLAVAPLCGAETELPDSVYRSPEEVAAAIMAAERQATEASVVVAEAYQGVMRATQALQAARGQAREAGIEMALEQVGRAESLYREVIASLVGVDVETITALRDQGLEWGRIASELGVDPGLLGLEESRESGDMGQPALQMSNEGFAVDPEELAEATARSLGSGPGMEHDAGDSDVEGAGMGLGRNGTSSTDDSDDNDRNDGGSGGGSGGGGGGGDSDGGSGGGSGGGGGGGDSDGGSGGGSGGGGGGGDSDGGSGGGSGGGGGGGFM